EEEHVPAARELAAVRTQVVHEDGGMRAVQHDEPSGGVGVFHCERPGDAAAPVVPDDDRLPLPERLRQPAHVGDQLRERVGRVAYVTIHRPEVMNALHPPANEELSRVWDDVGADPEVWVAILTGAGDRAFSAGNDLKWTALHGVPRMPKGGFGGLVGRDDLWKPLIAAVNGVALGGGLEIALACDIIVAADHARLGLPDPRVGLMAAAGGLHRLPRAIPFRI